MVRSFQERFPEFVSSHEEGIKKFLNRVDETIFSKFEESYWYDDQFKNFCFILGEKSSHYRLNNFWLWNNYRWIESLTWRDFKKTLKILESLAPDYHPKIKNLLIFCKETDWIDIWIRFHDWVFYPLWDPILDKGILEKSIDIVSKYKKAEQFYKDALLDYSNWNLPESLTKCYSSLEELAKNVLDNAKTLEKNKDDLIKSLKKESVFTNTWINIIKQLTSYLHDFSTRHWSEIENIEQEEVDATIYLVGIIINLFEKR